MERLKNADKIKLEELGKECKQELKFYNDEFEEGNQARRKKIEK